MAQYLKNRWYMAAWTNEVGEAFLSRRILGRSTLLYRKEDGGVAAMLDRCPHRFAPLSLGTRKGDRVICGYHGLSFDPSGACVHNPFAQSIPAGATVPGFPVVERDQIVWLWPGEDRQADPGLIPDFSMLAESPYSKTLTGITPMRANFEYGTDNLMDLSHIEFVHKGSFAGAGVIFAGKHNMCQKGETLHSNWSMPNVPAPAHTRGVYPPGMITDHWLDMRWDAPASMYLQIGACPAGARREEGVIVHQAHILTPETDGTAHYFWASTYATPAGVPDQGQMVRELLSQAFIDEDKPMIEAAFANLDGEEFWSQRPVSLGIDQGGTRARRLIEAMLRAEKQAQSGVAAE